ncbi:MAG: ABC transporter ATP-binding protein [Actinomycetota bacterium]|nr:ABC transporter ATP-binding protein [Actinomycetota bacterium]
MLELDRIGFAYRSGSWVFRDVSARIDRGAVTTVLAPNGRGKTTLLRCAAGLLEPQEGRVRRAHRMAYVPQAYNVTFGYRAIEMVLMGRVRHVAAWSVPGRRDRVAAIAAMERVGLGDLADRPFFELSGGEQQLVLIARALAAESPLLILDEPASALDLRNQSRVLALLRSLAADGMAILLTTHQPDHAYHVADAVILMHAVQDVRVGPADALLTDVALSELYGVRLRSMTFTDGPVVRRALATIYEP